ncbi:mitochondrial resolvase Ydc2 [Usnea florida]
MASRLSWLGSCTNAQLKTLARAIGVNTSGTKPILTSALRDHLPKRTLDLDKSQRTRILSIDMGIRNLAYCCLVLPRAGHQNTTGVDKPVVQNWTRLAISEESTKSGQSKDNLLTEANGNLAELGKAKASRPKEAFDPATYSKHAYDLVSTLVDDLKPTHVLIERQRFRSLGGSAVLEWTLRVNMFEAMIYAVLKTFSERGLWQGVVHSVAPSKVSNFWITDSETIRKGRSGSISAKTKTAKINMVAEWLKDGTRFELKGAAAQLGEEYLSKKTGRVKTSSVKQKSSTSKARDAVGNSVQKLDDLADCLLQGMAWIKWDENRRLILTKGAEALALLKQA